MQVIIYHNPRCSKSRATLKLLKDHGVDPDVVEYLKTPPNAEEIDRILERLGIEPRQLMRTGESEYKAHRLDDPGLSRDALIEALVRHPVLIQRPIVVTGNQARIGRPPEAVLEIL